MIVENVKIANNKQYDKWYNMKMINKYYHEIKNIYSTVRGSRLTPPLSDLLDRIDSANSDCKCH